MQKSANIKSDLKNSLRGKFTLNMLSIFWVLYAGLLFYLMFKYLAMIYFWNILFCTLIKTIHNICMYIIITYGTLYCFSNNLYRGGNCIDNIMTLLDEMFENSMRQGNNNEELLLFQNWYYVFVYIYFFKLKLVFITFSDFESGVSLQWFYLSAGPSPAKICVI